MDNLPPKTKGSYQVDDGVITEQCLGYNWDWSKGSGNASWFARNELGDEFEGEAFVTIFVASTGEQRTYKVNGWKEHKTSSREIPNKRVAN